MQRVARQRAPAHGIEEVPVEVPQEPACHPARRLSVLLLCDDDRDHANTVLDHIRALQRLSTHEVYVYNSRGVPDSAALNFDEFDVVVVHYSLVLISEDYVSTAFVEKLRAFGGLKVQLIQDEYRWVDAMAAMMRYVGIHVLFTLVPPAEIPKIWGERLPGVDIIPTLAGYVPEHLARIPAPPVHTRPLDVGYRGRELPFWLGRIGQEKVWIGESVLARAPRYGLRCDIAWSEDSRIYGRRWVDFLLSCRTTLGSESGATITDFDGSVERKVKEYQTLHPLADFEEVHREVLAPYEGNVRMNVVSPRVLEAAALRTPMILFPGEYSGVVIPWEHYIPLAKDFSNMDDVARLVREPHALQAMADRTYRDVVASGRFSYAAFVRQFDQIISARGTRRTRGPTFRFRLAAAETAVRAPGVVFARRIGERRMVQVHNGLKVIATAWMISSCAPLRQIAWWYARDGRLRAQVPAAALARDLAKLGMIQRAHAGSICGRWFRVDARVQSDGTLMLSSRRTEDAVITSTDEEILAAAREGRITRVVWDHSRIGRCVYFPVASIVWVPFGGLGGINEMAALAAVLRRGCEPARILLRALGAQQPDGTRRATGRRGLHSLPVEVARLLAALHILASDPAGRQLLTRFVRDAEVRRAVPHAALLRDIVKLGVLRRAEAGTIAGRPFRVDVRVASDGALLLVSRAAGAPSGSARREEILQALRDERVCRILWDHSPLGRSVDLPVLPGVSVPIGGPRGVNDLDALAAFARMRPGALEGIISSFGSDQPEGTRGR